MPIDSSCTDMQAVHLSQGDSFDRPTHIAAGSCHAALALHLRLYLLEKSQ